MTDKYLINNSLTLNRFDEFQNQGLEPKLSVFLGRSLVITTYKTDSLLKKIFQIFKNINIRFLKSIGTLESNNKKIQEIKDKVNQYHYRKVQMHLPIQIAEISNQIDTLDLNRSRLISEVNNLNEKKQLLDDGIVEARRQHENIQKQYLEVQKRTMTKYIGEEEIKNLNKTKENLKIEIQELKKYEGNLEPIKNELQVIRDQKKQLIIESNRIKSDISQHDYKTMYATLKSDYVDLEIRSKQEEGYSYSNGYSAGYSAGLSSAY